MENVRNMGINVFNSIRKRVTKGQENKTNFAYYNFYCVKFILPRFLSFYFDCTHINTHTHTRYTMWMQESKLHVLIIITIIICARYSCVLNSVKNSSWIFIVYVGVSIFSVYTKFQCDFLFLVILDFWSWLERRELMGIRQERNIDTHGQTI